MKHFLSAAVLIAALAPRISADEVAGPKPSDSRKILNQARRAGWEATLLVLRALESSDPKEFPGIAAFVKDLHRLEKKFDPKLPPERWPALDVDTLVAHNPHFWQACYEIAPGDSALFYLHGGLLLSAGEARRAAQLMALARQSPGIPKVMRAGMDQLLGHALRVARDGDRWVQEGIKRFDRGDRAGAIKKYREALAAWPQNGWAHYELGMTLFVEQEVAAGRKAPRMNSVTVNGNQELSPEVVAKYALARRHDPFLWRAYQGKDSKVIHGLLSLVKKTLPAWKQIAGAKEPVEDKVLLQFAEGCQEAGLDEFALVARQILAARRARYAPSDFPFIRTSLRRLAPGPQTEVVLRKLAGKDMKVRQLIKPEK